MKLVRKDRSVLDGTFYTKTKNYKILLEFLNSDMDVAEVEGYTQKTATICYTSLKNSINHYKFNSIGVSTKGDHVYLYKKNISENE